MLLDWLEMQQPDLLGIQETKVQDADFPREALGIGYHPLLWRKILQWGGNSLEGSAG